MANTKKTILYSLGDGESISKKYEGLIHRGSNKYRKPYWWVDKHGIKRAKNHYFVETECNNCGMKSLSYESNYKRHGKAFCSKKCQYESYTCPDGTKKRKRGKSLDSHVMVKASAHHSADRNGYVPEHRLVVEKVIGRPLNKEEVVHHINCIKDDNRPSNLALCKNSQEHFLAHGSLNKCVAELLEIGVIEFEHESKTYQVKKP